MSLNKVILMGNMCADPELKQTQGGVSVCSFNIAVNRKYSKDGKNEVDFITIVAWRQQAEFICKYFKKGQAIVIVGELQTRNWTDNQGNKRYATEIDKYAIQTTLHNFPNTIQLGDAFQVREKGWCINA